MDPSRVELQEKIKAQDKTKVGQGGEKLGKNNESFPDKIFHHFQNM